ncbi:MAG: gliding motility protein GldM [Chitinophagales bacterium]|nr:MAG: gliding motility protein GldM [Chitinophagales bacterium]
MRSTNPLRQKLINLLYLVLIGMIVLNLPVEFIEAFTDLNRTLERANYRLDQRNRKAMKQVSEFSRLDSARFARVYANIVTAKAASDSAINFLESIKQDLILRGKGYDPESHHLINAIDATIPTRRMIYDGVARQTKDVLFKTKAELLKLLGPEEQTMLDSVLVTTETITKADGRIYEWEKYYFDNVPLGAVVALLTKFQNDVRLAEALVINKHYELAENGISFVLAKRAASEDIFDFDTIMLEREDRGGNVFEVGEEAVYKVTMPDAPDEVVKSAVIYTYDQNNKIIDSFLFKEGVGEISLRTDEIGEFKIKGVVKYRYPDEGIGEGDQGEDQEKADAKEKEGESTFELNYSVVNPAKPLISSLDYEVLYIGVNNPLRVYHPDYSPENYNVSITQGKISYDGRNFYARVYRPGLVTVTLSVPDQGGGFKKVAVQEFKAEELPQPRAKLYNSYGGQMPASIFKKQRELHADIQGLKVDAKFRVIEFNVVYVNKAGLGIFREHVKGSYFTDKSLELINLAEPGDIYIFENIKIKGPDGRNIDVEPLVFTII